MRAWIEILSVSVISTYSIWSLSSWGRGLKSNVWKSYETCNLVALFMRAWIEITFASFKIHFPRRRSLHEGVDWNQDCKSTVPVDISRSLHEGVDWNHCHAIKRHQFQSRSLHEGVDWNKNIIGNRCLIFSRSLHEGVDWNTFLLYPDSLPKGRSLHESVDWNYNLSLNKFCLISRSLQKNLRN